MLVSEGDQRSVAIDVRLAGLLSCVAGAVNAAGFQAAGFFSANMTGNASAMSDHIGLGQLESAGVFAALIGIFVIGAFCSGLLIEVGRNRKVRAIYAYSVTLEGMLLIILGGLDALIPDLVGPLGLVVGLSFIMGLQNAATTRISNARVRTTHVSGMATDIGLGLAALVSAAPDNAPALDRLKLYAVTILAFVAGGVGGVLLYLVTSGWAFTAIGILLLIIALPEAQRVRASERF